MTEPRCICGHPKSWHAKTNDLYHIDPEKFAPMKGGHPDAAEMCALRQCVCCEYVPKVTA